jgi:serine/threonine protein kinase
LSKGEEVEKNKNKNKYGTKCEVYSFGILLWEIAECRIPYEGFKDMEEITKEVTKGHRESFTESTDIPEKYRSLVNKAVGQNPDHRPTFAKMLIDLQDIFKNVPARLSLIKSVINIKCIKWNKLTDISKVSSGHFGSVSRALWLNTNDYVILKKLNNSNDIQEDALQHEIKMLNRAHACENIIRFIGITQEPQSNNYCIVMEYADSGDLRAYLAKNFSLLDWDQKHQLAFDITNGIHYLHEENIIHRDLVSLFFTLYF